MKLVVLKFHFYTMGYYVECFYLYSLKLIVNHDFASVKEIPEKSGDVLSHQQVQDESSSVLSCHSPHAAWLCSGSYNETRGPMHEALYMNGPSFP